MPAELVIASLDRAADHGAPLAVLLGVVAIGGLIYGLVRLAGRARAGRRREP